MKYVFGNHYGEYDLFKIFFDVTVADKDYLISIKKLMNDEDVMKEQLACLFHDNYNNILEKVEIVFLDETLEISREELYQLLIIGIKRYLLMYSEDREEMKCLLDVLLDRCKILTKIISEDFDTVSVPSMLINE